MPTRTPSAGLDFSLAIREQTQVETAAQLLEWARADLAMSLEEIAEILGASSRSVARWSAREVPPSPEYRDRLEKFSELRYLLHTVFRDRKSRVTWLHNPLALLRGRSPLGVLRKGGWDDVLGILAGLESGSFA